MKSEPPALAAAAQPGKDRPRDPGIEPKSVGPTILLFVYGTIKRGQPNHRLMLEARFLGEAATAPQYTLLKRTIFSRF